jgi:hypothetical protein
MNVVNVIDYAAELCILSGADINQVKSDMKKLIDNYQYSVRHISERVEPKEEKELNLIKRNNDFFLKQLDGLVVELLS